MTDDERVADPISAANALPPGSLVVLRARDDARRAELATNLMKIARANGLKVVVSADPELAVRANADGTHFPEVRIGDAAQWRRRRPDWLITCAAHSLSACIRASTAGASAVFLSPVFPTESHPDRASLGLFRAIAIARTSLLPTYALGGVGARSVLRLGPDVFVGIAAVEALAARH